MRGGGACVSAVRQRDGAHVRVGTLVCMQEAGRRAQADWVLVRLVSVPCFQEYPHTRGHNTPIERDGATG